MEGMMSIDPGTAIGGVQLRVSDLDRSLAFYTDVLGLDLLHHAGDHASLGSGGRALVDLRRIAGAVRRPRRSTGVYHFALLVPGRIDLGHALARLAESRWPLQGASDHGVSEALYLGDPDGIGIEIYRDRERGEWPVTGGLLQMVSEPLDLQALLDDAIAVGIAPPRVPPHTRMGHVHLQVRDLDEADAFYHGVLGFDVTQRMASGALFVSAGGYHHHLGLNTWGVTGAPSAPENSPGLDYLRIVLPGREALHAARDAVSHAGATAEPHDGGWLVRDPSSNAALLAAG
ncbi:MAG TPA: VOC family protein [Gemmatimonadaceae bacterium]|nr:VOC family protein [Gemmatimonadaceae bacterium]